MRRVAYSLTSPDGNVHPGEGTLLEFLFVIPGLLHAGILPPRRVLDRVLVAGLWDTGGGVLTWEPFMLDAEQYKALLEAFKETSEVAGWTEDLPDWVQSYSDWSILLAGKLFDVPIERHRELHARFEALANERDQAIAAGDQAAAHRLNHEADAAADALTAFLEEHLARVQAAQG